MSHFMIIMFVLYLLAVHNSKKHRQNKRFVEPKQPLKFRRSIDDSDIQDKLDSECESENREFTRKPIKRGVHCKFRNVQATSDMLCEGNNWAEEAVNEALKNVDRH